MAKCTPLKGIEDIRFTMNEYGMIGCEQFRVKDSNGEYVYPGDLIIFDEGDNIPEEVYIDDTWNRMAVDSYHSFHLLDELSKFYKYE